MYTADFVGINRFVTLAFRTLIPLTMVWIDIVKRKKTANTGNSGIIFIRAFSQTKNGKKTADNDCPRFLLDYDVLAEQGNYPPCLSRLTSTTISSVNWLRTRTACVDSSMDWLVWLAILFTSSVLRLISSLVADWQRDRKSVV